MASQHHHAMTCQRRPSLVQCNLCSALMYNSDNTYSLSQCQSYGKKHIPPFARKAHGRFRSMAVQGFSMSQFAQSGVPLAEGGEGDPINYLSFGKPGASIQTHAKHSSDCHLLEVWRAILLLLSHLWFGSPRFCKRGLKEAFTCSGQLLAAQLLISAPTLSNVAAVKLIDIVSLSLPSPCVPSPHKMNLSSTT